jgi:hypothetical protein
MAFKMIVVTVTNDAKDDLGAIEQFMGSVGYDFADSEETWEYEHGLWKACFTEMVESSG